MRTGPRPFLAVLIASLVAGCPAEPPANVQPLYPRSVATPKPTATPTPSATATPTPGPTEPPRSALVAGKIQFTYVEASPFADQKAYRVQAMAAGNAEVALKDLALKPLKHNEEPIVTTTDSLGRYVVRAPEGLAVPYLLEARLRDNHRLAGVVMPGALNAVVDEASTVVAAMITNQIATGPSQAGEPTVAAIASGAVAALEKDTRALLTRADFAAVGTPPVVALLKQDAGDALRHLMVTRFGMYVTPTGTGYYDTLSDHWKKLWGFRPIAATRMAGGGQGGEGADGPAAALSGPTHATSDALGHLYVADEPAHRIRFLPRTNIPARWAASQALTGGKLYTLLGAADGPTTLADFNALYQPRELAARSDAAQAPLVYDSGTSKAFPIFSPYRLLIDATDGARHLFFTSRAGHRVFCVPDRNFTRYGRSFQAGRLYTIAGTGASGPAASAGELGDDGPAAAARLFQPTGLALDSRGNLYLWDGGNAMADQHGGLRMVRASDGKILAQPLTRNGQPFKAPEASDIRLVETDSGNWIYVSDTRRHAVFRVPLPNNLATMPTAAIEIEPVLGVFDQRGAFKEGIKAPTRATLGLGLPEADVRLDGPTGLALTTGGDLVVADANNNRLLVLDKAGVAGAGKVYLLGGLEAGTAPEGDSRLLMFPRPGLIDRDPYGNLLVPDSQLNLVRRLWTSRGAF